MPLAFVGSVPPLIVVAVVGDSEDGGRGGILDLELFIKSIGHMIKNCVTTELSSESSVHHVTINYHHTFTRGPEDTMTSARVGVGCVMQIYAVNQPLKQAFALISRVLSTTITTESITHQLTSNHCRIEGMGRCGHTKVSFFFLSCCN